MSSRQLLAQLDALHHELLRGAEPMPEGLSSLQQELWRTARAERLATALQETEKARWEEAIRARHFPQVSRDWEWHFPWLWIEEILIPWSQREGLSPEALVALPDFAESLDLPLLSRFFAADEARTLLAAEPSRWPAGAALPRFRGNDCSFGDWAHEFRHLCGLALFLNERERWAIGRFLSSSEDGYDLAYNGSS